VNRAPGTVFVGVCACERRERPRRRNCSGTSTVCSGCSSHVYCIYNLCVRFHVSLFSPYRCLFCVTCFILFRCLFRVACLFCVVCLFRVVRFISCHRLFCVVLYLHCIRVFNCACLSSVASLARVFCSKSPCVLR
jgi:hypothetical protein